MAAEASHDGQDALAAAWPGALPLLLERVAALEDAVAALLANALTDATRDGARREAHRLAGALGSFGVGSGSIVARDLETAFEVVPPQSAAPGLAERVMALRRAVEAGPTAPDAADQAPRVVLAGLTSARSAPILRAADGRGWRVSTATGAPEPGTADVALLDGGLPDLEAAVGRLAGAGGAVALLVEGDVDRVGLVRAGARRLIGTGLAPEAVVAELAGLAADRRTVSTVLVVDDDPISLEIVAAALRGAGHEVAVCGDALDFWTALERGHPDLVALDVQMPGADGVGRAARCAPTRAGAPRPCSSSPPPRARPRWPSCSPPAVTTTCPSRSSRRSWWPGSTAGSSGSPAPPAPAPSTTTSVACRAARRPSPGSSCCSRSPGGSSCRSPSRRWRSTGSPRCRTPGATRRSPPPAAWCGRCCARATSARCGARASWSSGCSGRTPMTCARSSSRRWPACAARAPGRSRRPRPRAPARPAWPSIRATATRSPA